MNPRFNEAHPWAVNIYHGRRHVLTEYFTTQGPAEYFHTRVALNPGWSATLMQYQGDMRWREIRHRQRKEAV